MTTHDFNVWTLTVDSLCRERLACSWADLCGEQQPLSDGFSAGMSPLEFVDWWARKYDLIVVDEWLHPFGKFSRNMRREGP